MIGLATGDKHLGLVSDGVSRLGEQRTILDACVAELNRGEVNVYVDLGDLFDVPRPGSDAHALGLRYATQVADWRSINPDKRQAYFLRGNHDVTSRGGISALEPIKELGTTDDMFPEVVELPKAVRFNDVLLVFLPFLTSVDSGDHDSVKEFMDVVVQDMVERADNEKIGIVAFSHLEVPGSTNNAWDSRQRDVGLTIPDVLLEYERLIRVYAGHIHRYQHVDPVTVVGSALHVDFGEALDPKGIVRFETSHAR